MFEQTQEVGAPLAPKDETQEAASTRRCNLLARNKVAELVDIFAV